VPLQYVVDFLGVDKSEISYKLIPSRIQNKSFLPGPGLVKFPRPLYLEHKIATVDVFHNKEQTILSLKQKKDRHQGGDKDLN
jgi:hypothetical protein